MNDNMYINVLTILLKGIHDSSDVLMRNSVL